jgi:ATP-binding cassette subfamily C protein CydC
MSTREASSRPLWRVARLEPRDAGRLALSVALASSAMAASIALLATSGYLISRAAQRPQILTLMVAIVAVRAFGIGRAVLRYGERLASHDLAFRQLARLRTRFYRALVPLVPGQVRGHGSSDLLARFVGDVDSLQDLYLRALIPALVALAVIAGAGAAAWLLLPAGGAIVICALAAVAVVPPWLSATVSATSTRRQAAARAQLTTSLVETIDGAPELALAGRAGERVEILDDADRRLSRLARRDAFAASGATALGSLLAGAGLLAVLVVAITAVHSGRLAGVLVAALVFLFLAASEAVAPLPVAARRLRSCAVAARRLEDVCDRHAAITDPVRPQHPSGSGDLCVHDARFRYGEQDAWILQRAELVLRPGDRVALIGPSGEGKTTLAEMLVRFHDPNAGRVTLDGIDLRDLTQADVRRAVLLCGQDAHLFNTTVRENLLLARRDASESELWSALRAVELDEWVRGCADGLDTFVGQEGELVSGGQRQRLALARALVSDARFLVLDEPIAHLDGPLAARVLRSFLTAAGRRGVLVITHEQAALGALERALRLEHGVLAPA